MKNENSKLIIILILNLFIICLLTLVNSRLSQWGIFLYLPGLFFFLTCIFLDNLRGMIVCGITGLFLDVLFLTPLGLHGLLLPLFHIIGKEWLKSNPNYRPWRSVIFQFSVNLILIVIWSILLLFENESVMKFKLSRFLSDLLISSIIIIPLSFYVSQFAGKLIRSVSRDNSQNI
jgi:hypothetical protein